MVVRSSRVLSVTFALCLAPACDTRGHRDAESDLDATVVDGGRSDTSAMDVDVGRGEDARAAPPLTCNLETGVECDGDWEDRCDPVCPEGQCCSPQAGSFTCVERSSDGACPAADIWLDTGQIEGETVVQWRFFPPDDCALVEGCVEAPGWRRLLLFEAWTPNTGEADLYLGRPEDHLELFEYSPCHDHHHFGTYARYDLRTVDGELAAVGHKQAFCLLDFYRYPGTDESGTVYQCGNQGIQRGYQDVYGRDLDCQWVDITEVEAGEYVLRVDLNYEGTLLESNYANNQAEVSVQIPPDDSGDDVRDACPDATARGIDRSCALVRAGEYECTPSERYDIACSSACGLGECTGDPFLRICTEGHDPNCHQRFALAEGDDCGSGCRQDADGNYLPSCCPFVENVECPTEGRFVVFYGAYNPAEVASCTVNVASAD